MSIWKQIGSTCNYTYWVKPAEEDRNLSVYNCTEVGNTPPSDTAGGYGSLKMLRSLKEDEANWLTSGEKIAEEFSRDKVSLTDLEKRRLANMIDRDMVDRAVVKYRNG